MRLLTIITLEVLFTNLFITFTCLKRKYSIKTNIIVLTIFTALLFTIYRLFLTDIDGQSFIQIILGAFFFIPLLFLFDTDIKKIIIIMTFSWSYSLTINAFSHKLALYFDSYDAPIVIIQTILLLGSFWFILDLAKTKIFKITEKVSPKQENYLILMGLSIFMGITILRYFTPTSSSIQYLLLLTIFSVVGLTSYIMMYNIVMNSHRLSKINTIAYNDLLTGIPNRFSFFEAIDSKIEAIVPFKIFYMDLDGLKYINDTYGHPIGDEYLTHFTKTVSDYIQSDGTLYRIAGDEFICIISKSLSKYTILSFQKEIQKRFNFTYDFLGVSLGSSLYPSEGKTPQEIINKADKRMYDQKKSKKRKLRV